MNFLIVILTATFGASVVWLLVSRTLESFVATLTALGALVACFAKSKAKTKKARQHQHVSHSSVGIQAGRDVSVRDVKDNNNAK